MSASIRPIRVLALSFIRARCRTLTTNTITTKNFNQHNNQQQASHLNLPQYPWSRRFFSTQGSSNKSTTDNNDDKDNKNRVRLSRLLSQHTQRLAISRREAERLIKLGEVTVAGQVITSPHYWLNWDDLMPTINRPGLIKVSGKGVALSPGHAAGTNNNTTDRRVWLVNKLRGEVVADFDPQGRPSLMERLHHSGVGKRGKQQRSHLKPIGRLDMTTEGLILVTTCGHYARDMELPTNQLHRTYRVRVHGLLTRYKVQAIQRGLRIDTKDSNEVTRYGPMKVHMQLPKGQKNNKRGTNTWITISCTEGKNRQIRNVLKHLGCKLCDALLVDYFLRQQTWL